MLDHSQEALLIDLIEADRRVPSGRLPVFHVMVVMFEIDTLAR